MNNIIQWQGNNLDVQARLVPRFLWTTASIDVFLDGKCILRTGGQLKLTGTQSATFHHAGKPHQAELKWGQGAVRSFPYILQIDGSPVCESRVFVKNWLTVMAVKLSILALMTIIGGMAVYRIRQAQKHFIQAPTNAPLER